MAVQIVVCGFFDNILSSKGLEKNEMIRYNNEMELYPKMKANMGFWTRHRTKHIKAFQNR